MTPMTPEMFMDVQKTKTSSKKKDAA